MYSLIMRLQAYLEPRLKDSRPNVLCHIYIRRIEHLYYKVNQCSEHRTWMCVSISVYVFACVSVCFCVCVLCIYVCAVCECECE